VKQLIAASFYLLAAYVSVEAIAPLIGETIRRRVGLAIS